MQSMRNRWLYLLGVLIVMMALAACGSGTRGNAPAPSTPVGTAQPGGAAGGTTIQAVARNFNFSLDTTRASAGTVTFVVRNDSPAPHDFAIQGNGVNRKTPMVQPGQTASLTVELKPGTYTYICTVPGHDHLGMTGTFTVT